MKVTAESRGSQKIINQAMLFNVEAIILKE